MKFIAKRTDKDSNGLFHIVGHANAESIEVLFNGKINSIDHRMLAKIIKYNPEFKDYKGVRLLSCNTGSVSIGIAQKLANKLGLRFMRQTLTIFHMEMVFILQQE